MVTVGGPGGPRIHSCVATPDVTVTALSGSAVTITPRLFVVGLVAALTAACTSAGGEPGSAAATVNGVDIPRQVVVDAVEELHGFSELSADERAELADRIGVQERETLRLHIVNRVLEDLLDERGVEVDEDAAEEAREEALEMVGGEDALRESLSELQLTLTVFNEVFLPQQGMIEALRRDIAGDEDVATRTVRHILVEDEAAAQDAYDRVEGGEDFGDVAADVSTDPGSAGQGGELPPAVRGQFVPEFDAAAWDATLNDLLGPVESQFGYHVIEVLDEESIAVEDLEDEQFERLIAEDLNEVVSAAFDDAEIEVDPSFGEWDPDQRNVVPIEEVGSGSDDPFDRPADDPVSPDDGELDAEDGDAS